MEFEIREIKFNELLFVSGGNGASCPGHFEGDVPPADHVCQRVVITPKTDWNHYFQDMEMTGGGIATIGGLMQLGAGSLLAAEATASTIAVGEVLAGGAIFFGAIATPLIVIGFTVGLIGWLMYNATDDEHN